MLHDVCAMVYEMYIFRKNYTRINFSEQIHNIMPNFWKPLKMEYSNTKQYRHVIFESCDPFDPNIACDIEKVNSLSVYVVFTATHCIN